MFQGRSESHLTVDGTVFPFKAHFSFGLLLKQPAFNCNEMNSCRLHAFGVVPSPWALVVTGVLSDDAGLQKT